MSLPEPARIDSLALHEGRFMVSAALSHQGDRFKITSAVLLAPDALVLCSFHPANPEILIKLLDGRHINGHWWVQIASVSQVAVEITVQDVVTGEANTYRSIEGPFSPIADFTAFKDAYRSFTDSPSPEGNAAAPKLADIYDSSMPSQEKHMTDSQLELKRLRLFQTIHEWAFNDHSRPSSYDPRITTLEVQARLLGLSPRNIQILTESISGIRDLAIDWWKTGQEEIGGEERVELNRRIDEALTPLYQMLLGEPPSGPLAPTWPRPRAGADLPKSETHIG